MEPLDILLLAPSILLGLTLHEFAHGLVAFLLGDPTAKQQGRLTLNPLKHLDLFGTLLLFLVHFGWAKPVQVNPSNFANPKRDMVYVALAGPFVNLLLAAVFGLVIRLLGPGAPEHYQFLFLFLYLGLLINISLAIFNLLPVPPLDGSRLIYALWPAGKEASYRIFERVSGVILFGAMLAWYFSGSSIISTILNPVVRFFLRLFAGM